MADSAEKSNKESNSSQTYPKLSPLASCVSTSQLSVITLDDSVCSQIPPMTRVTRTSPGWRTTSESSFMSTTPNMSSFTNLRQPGGNVSGESDNSMFGSFQNSMYFSVEEDRRRVESQLAAFRGPCLLDCMVIDLTEVDVFSATRTERLVSLCEKKPISDCPTLLSSTFTKHYSSTFSEGTKASSREGCFINCVRRVLLGQSSNQAPPLCNRPYSIFGA